MLKRVTLLTALTPWICVSGAPELFSARAPSQTEQAHSALAAVEALAEESRVLSQRNPETALGKAHAALALAKELNSPIARAVAHNAIGLAESKKGAFVEARESHQKALELATDQAAPRVLALAHLGLARCQLHASESTKARDHLDEASRLLGAEAGDVDKISLHNLRAILHHTQNELRPALEQYRQALEYAERAGEQGRQARLHYNLGALQFNLEDPEGAASSLARALELNVSEPGSQFTGLLHSAIGRQALARGEREEARAVFEEALSQAIQSENAGLEALHQRHLAGMDLADGDYASAESRFRRSLELARLEGALEAIATSAASLARVLASLKRFDEATELGVEATQIALDLNMPRVKMEVNQLVSEVFALTGDAESALQFHRRYTDALIASERGARSAETNRLRLELERVEQARIRAEDRRQSDSLLHRQALIRNGIIAITALITIVLLVVQRSLRQKSRLNAQLEEQYRAIRKTNAKVTTLNSELELTLAEVRRLSGLIPICCHCKSVRDDAGYWRAVESYISEHSEAQFSHGICPECAVEHYEPARN